jgi:hypothetical protein
MSVRIDEVVQNEANSCPCDNEKEKKIVMGVKHSFVAISIG